MEYSFFIQVFQIIGFYSGYWSNPIGPFLIRPQFSQSWILGGSQNFPQYQISHGQRPQLYIGIVTLLELMLIVGQLDHCILPSLFDQVQTFFQYPIIVVWGKCICSQRQETCFQRDYSLSPVCHRKGGFPDWPTRHCSIRPKDMRQFLHPSSLCIIQSLFKSIHYNLIDSFSLSISLQIGWSGISILYPQIRTVLSEGFAIKLKAIIWD